MRPLVSILIPSRHRVAMLQEVIIAFHSLASDLRRVETIVRLHLNDDASCDWMRSKPDGVRFIVDSDESLGYESMGMFVNTLAACSNGDWLWPASDDMVPLTAGWDDLLAALPAGDCNIANPSVEGYPQWRIPIISRSLYEAIGSLGHSSHADVYIDALAGLGGGRHAIPVRMKNLNPEEVVVRDIAKTWHQFQGAENSARFLQDKIKLGAVLGKKLGAWMPAHAKR